MKIEELLEMQTLPDNLVDQFEKRANTEREAGGKIDIDPTLPTVAITMSNGEEYLFKEWEAEELLAAVPENIIPDDYLLVIAQSW